MEKTAIKCQLDTGATCNIMSYTGYVLCNKVAIQICNQQPQDRNFITMTLYVHWGSAYCAVSTRDLITTSISKS